MTQQWKLVPVEPTPEILAAAAVAVWPTASESDIQLARAAAKIVLMSMDAAPGSSLESIALGIATMAPAYRAMLAAAPTPPASAQPESQREGYPHDDAKFVALCREHDILGTAMQGLVAVFWRAASAQDDAKDAARYRWLRDPQSDVALVLDKQTGYVPEDERIPGIGGYHTYEYRAGEELDAAIDEAIAASQQQEG